MPIVVCYMQLKQCIIGMSFTVVNALVVNSTR